MTSSWARNCAKDSPFADFRLWRGVTWLEPRLMTEVSYAEIVDGRLRAAVLRGVGR
jgi:hypothetical protein